MRLSSTVTALTILLVGVLVFHHTRSTKDSTVSDQIPGAIAQAPIEKATFGAGCFWHVEAAFREMKGVIATSVGYSGGTLDRPTYQAVCSDRTGHAEVVEVQFDPTQITYERLLEAFFGLHDPTTPNRQGPDVGKQYRSVVFYHSPAQQRAAEAAKEKLAASGRLRRPIVTQIVPAETYWRAEEYHQQYFEKTGQTSCGIH